MVLYYAVLVGLVLLLTAWVAVGIKILLYRRRKK